ncbi:MAG: Formylglycine-generating sulfatase enzyme [Candidatus Scalindua rubra]|uniref:Formylglycine-generating sulfatase enzyme n=1 Tax=Candidatus Scalindua rubra TaxID=1872076 RepID=A0A1E3XAU3_9BACT|nr:MAG: Formylglycine-generating sulfatase enzyme [Candidatus Scalindua rubra]
MSTGYPWDRGSLVPEDFLVVNVSWDDAVAYAEWAGKRLPTNHIVFRCIIPSSELRVWKD